MSPSSVLRQIHVQHDAVLSWDGKPALLEIADLVPIQNRDDDTAFPCPVLVDLIPGLEKTLFFASVAQRLLAFPKTGQSIVLLLDAHTSRQAAGIIADLLGLLPQSSQWVQLAMSHVVSLSDAPPNATLICSYPEADFAQQCRRRNDPQAPFVYDLTSADHLHIDSLSGYGEVLQDVLCSPCPTGELVAARRLFDELGFDHETVEVFGRIWRLRHGLMHISDANSFASIENALAQLSTDTCASYLESFMASGSVSKQIRAITESDARIRALTTIALDKHWPSNARKWAFDALLADSSVELRELCDRLEESDEVLSRIRPHFAQIPSDRIQPVIQTSIDKGTDNSHRLAAELINSSPGSLESLSKWIGSLPSPSSSISSRLVHALLENARHLSNSATQPDTELSSRLIPIVKGIYQLSTKVPLENDDWDAVATFLIESARKLGRTNQEKIVKTLFSKIEPLQLRNAKVSRLLEQAAVNHRPALAEMFQMVGLLEPAIIDSPVELQSPIEVEPPIGLKPPPNNTPPPISPKTFPLQDFDFDGIQAGRMPQSLHRQSSSPRAAGTNYLPQPSRFMFAFSTLLLAISAVIAFCYDPAGIRSFLWPDLFVFVAINSLYLIMEFCFFQDIIRPRRPSTVRLVWAACWSAFVAYALAVGFLVSLFIHQLLRVFGH